MSTSEASQRIQLALARGQLDECLDQFDVAWHSSTTPELGEWLAALGDQSDQSWYSQLVSELIKIDLEQRWRRNQSLSQPIGSIPSTGAAPTGNLPWTPIAEDYRSNLSVAWPFEDIPAELFAEEYRVRQLWGDHPQHSLYESRCSREQWTELQEILRGIDVELVRRSTSSTVRSNDSSQPSTAGSLQIDLRVGDEIDDFSLLSLLGQGSFAKVFLAQQKSMQRLVALKVTLHRSTESPVLSQLDHPNVVRVYDERIVGPYTLMYMQFVPGDSLRFAVDLRRSSLHPPSGAEYVRCLTNVLANKGLSPSRRITESALQQFEWSELVAWLGSRLYAALEHAHHCGVYHRDVKPENILVTAEGEPMLLDFNLSFGQYLEGSSIEKSFGGSLAYMSPEQLCSLLGQAPISAVGASSDVYSLAIVLAELLHGQRPHDDKQATPEALLQVRRQPWSSKECDNGSSVPGLIENLRDALVPDPALRPSAGQLARRLRVCFHPQLREIYYPRSESWSAWIARYPLRSLIGFGLIPNACVSLLNIWANDRLTTHNFDRAFFDNVEKPWVNFIAYAVGVMGAVAILLPILRELRRGDWSSQERNGLARKTMRVPLQASLLIFLLWVASGLAFPLWNQWSPRSEVGALDVAGFVISQVIHGLIASVSTLAIISKVMIEAILPRFFTPDMPCLPLSVFDSNANTLRWASSIMAATPLLAVFALAVGDQFDRTVFVVLAIVGFAAHLFTSAFIPTVLKKIEALAEVTQQDV